ncbi:MAG: membrane protein insertase YidC [Maricaulis sp.]|jgi:YidC/Oxa1 family membrane protein insertase|nr:membrane protein insertase YidC [Maricaulis sp.]HAQ34487.1 membrane protein insertase YidC [Alphaproteobacteria bacterium]
MGDNRNMFIAIGVSLVFIIVYQMFVLGPAGERRQAAREAAEIAQQAELADPSIADDALSTGTATREDALAAETRIEIDGPAVSGSLSLTGARIDDLRLLRHETAVDDESPVVLLNPRGSTGALFAQDGWSAAGDGPTDTPGNTTEWTLVEGTTLTPDTPVTLEYRGSDGLVFRREISVDDNYMFTLTDTVENTTGNTAILSRYGMVRQSGIPEDFTNFFILHEGPIAVIDERLHDRKFNSMDPGDHDEWSGVGGWVGITTKNWMTAVIPDQSAEYTAEFRLIERQGDDIFQTSYLLAPSELAAGGTLTSVSRVFAGAKNVDILQAYEEDLGIQRFDMAVDWGMFWFLTRPYFTVLHWLAQLFGPPYGFGFAILAVTVLVKLLFFPLANRSYASMAKMKALQPKMDEIRKKHPDDKPKQQQEIIQLYQKEKVNPIAGCLPILLQIPVFYALYKTLFVTLEMRHQPFPGWIQDLSAPDPTSIWNLFGLIPWDPSGIMLIGGVLAIGAWPILMGLTMWAQQSLNPPPPDPTQRRIFAFLPLLFTFMLANFAAGLVIYWAWNNFLSVIQQYVIMRRQGVETQFDKLIKRIMNRGAGAES